MTGEIALTLGVLAVTVVLFVTELLRVDVTAILVMVALPWLGLIEPLEAFSGFASNAVMAMIAVMVLGYSIDASGATGRLVGPVTKLASGSERRMLGMVSAAVGLVSAFMQNIGATVLFLPGVRRIARRSGMDLSRLLMPMGFAAILGGTLTMIASGPLILLNDLLRQGGREPLGLFSVTPVGLVLLAAGIAYFLLSGRKLLPGGRPAGGSGADLVDLWNLPESVRVLRVPGDSGLAGRTIEEAGLWSGYDVHVLAAEGEDGIEFAPWRRTVLRTGRRYAMVSAGDGIDRLVAAGELEEDAEPCRMRRILESDDTGYAEMVVRHRSDAAGRTIRQMALRKTWGVEPILLSSGGDIVRGDISDRTLEGGDMLVVHGPWASIAAMGRSVGFLAASRVPEVRSLSSKPLAAVLVFAGAVALAVAGVRLSLALMSAVVAMLLLRVITIDEAYRAVDWRTVFLLAGLIPLGLAMERTGTAAWVAGGVMEAVTGAHPLLMMTAVALLATLFTLFMSNVAATILLVPLVMSVAPAWGIAPRALAVLVAVCASNSFVLPTHQVNALLMAQGGYRSADYMRAGGLFSILFVLIAVPAVYLLFGG